MEIELNLSSIVMAEISCLEDLLTEQRKEKKELAAKTQKLKHSVPKGDKKKKKDITAEIAQMLADLELKHENEIREFKSNICSTTSPEQKSPVLDKSDELNTEKHLNGSKINFDTTKNDTSDEHEAPNPDVPRMSKAQKRRNKKAMLEKERKEAIAAQEIENLNGLRNLESEEINKILSERHLAIHEVSSDGNCLYKAIEHQLSSLNLQKTTVQSLRESTAKYMLSHMEDYLPFLTHPETGDVLTEEQYENYCDDISKTSAWGGHIEIQALSHICGVPIEIIQAKGPSIFAGNETSYPKLILSYHRHAYGLGEHYNSVIPTAE